MRSAGDDPLIGHGGAVMSRNAHTPKVLLRSVTATSRVTTTIIDEDHWRNPG